ncbi:pts system, beta-glucoside-specific iiabc component, partial [Listeria ivanovii FSL F6-596]
KAQIIGGAAGGAYLGLMQVVANSFVFGSVITLPAFFGEDSSNFIQAIIGLLISMMVSMILAYIFINREEKLA